MKTVGIDAARDSNLSPILSHDGPDALSSSSQISIKGAVTINTQNIGQMQTVHHTSQLVLEI